MKVALHNIYYREGHALIVRSLPTLWLGSGLMRLMRAIGFRKIIPKIGNYLIVVIFIISIHFQVYKRRKVILNRLVCSRNRVQL